MGGVELSVCEAVRRLRTLGHDVTVLTSNYPPAISCPTEHVYRLPVLLKIERDWGELLFCPAVLSQLRKMDFEVVHAHTPRKFFAEWVPLFRFLSRRKFPFVVHIHLFDMGFLPSPLRAASQVYTRTVERSVFRSADKVIVQSNIHQRYLMSNFGVSADNIEIVPSAVDTEMFDPRRKVNIEHLRRKYGLGDGKVILYVGRLTSQKGVESLVRAMPLVMKEMPDVKLLIVGDGPLRAPLMRLATELRVGSNTVFANYVKHEEMPDVFSLGDVFVLPSLSESMPNVLLEAMAMEKPVVATAVGGVPEMVSNQTTGFLAETATASSLASPIIQVLSNDNLADRIGRQARKAVEMKFSWPYVLQKVVKVYEEVLSRYPTLTTRQRRLSI